MTKNVKISGILQRLTCAALLMFTVFACSKKQAIREEISITDLLGENETLVEVSQEVQQMPLLDSTFTSELNQKLFRKFNTKPHQKRTLLDRFTHESVEKTIFTSVNDTAAIIELFVYDFTDTNATTNAFNNWLACFGNNCQEIDIDSNQDKVDETPLWAAIYEEAIIVMKFTSESLKYKNELKQTVFQTKGQMLKHTINITADSHLKWE